MRNPNCSSELKPGEKLDELQRNGYVIIQDKERFCFGMDAVLLSGFARVKDGGTVLDMGTGTGIIPILLEAKTGASHLTGLEIQADSADMARRSVALNGLEEKIDIVQGDIREAAGLFPAASFDVVTCNPPYMAGGHGLTNPEAPKAIARHEVKCTFEDVAAQAAGSGLRPGTHCGGSHVPCGGHCLVYGGGADEIGLRDLAGVFRPSLLHPKHLQKSQLYNCLFYLFIFVQSTIFKAIKNIQNY